MGNGRWNIFYALLCLFWQTNISYYKTKLKVNTVNKSSYNWLISNTNKKYWFAFIWHPCICNCQVSIHQVTACFLGISLSVICLPLPSGSWLTWSLEWDRPDTTSASSRINSAQWRLDSICIHPHTHFEETLARKGNTHLRTNTPIHITNTHTYRMHSESQQPLILANITPALWRLSEEDKDEVEQEQEQTSWRYETGSRKRSSWACSRGAKPLQLISITFKKDTACLNNTELLSVCTCVFIIRQDDNAMKMHLLLYTHYLWLGVSETGVSGEKWKEEEEERKRKRDGTSDTKLYLAFIHLPQHPCVHLERQTTKQLPRCYRNSNPASSGHFSSLNVITGCGFLRHVDVYLFTSPPTAR